jgi:hypothetical protein
MIPVTPRTCEHLKSWCGFYQRNAKVYNPREVRFAIGFYQISQGMSWHIHNPVRWQSFCAASMHFIMCAEDYNLHLDLPEFLEDLTDSWKGWEHLMFTLGKAQQQVIYAGATSANSTRASRFSEAALQLYLTEAVEQCFSLVPALYREQGCFDEMCVLCNDLPSFRK